MFLISYINGYKKTLPGVGKIEKIFLALFFTALLLSVPYEVFATYQVELSETSMMSIRKASHIFFGIVIFVTLVTTLFPVAITALGLQLTVSGYDNVGMCFFFTGLFLTFYGKPKKKSKARKSESFLK